MVKLTAPAKVTLTLRVTGVRPDGYHLIEAEMVTVDLHDTVDIEPTSAATQVAIASPAGGLDTLVSDGSTPGGDAPGAVEVVPAGGDNLVARALGVAGRSATVRLHKRIPAGAGLGGGSADAAAVFRWAGCIDPQRTVTVGADVPFCVMGGRATVGGIGEQVDPLPFEPLALTLLTPPFGCSTPEVYRAWDDLGGPTADGPNDLEPAALRRYPELARWRDALGDATGQTPVLAGSGATWFVRGSFPGQGRVVVRTVPTGWESPDATG